MSKTEKSFATLSGDAYGEKGGAKSKAAGPFVVPSGEPKAEKSNGGVISKK